MVDFSLIRPDNPLPVLQSEVFAPLSPLQPFSPMPGSEKRVFSLDCSHHTNFSQVATYSLRRYRLVGHIFKSLGYLHCIFSLAHSHYAPGISNISRGELARTATRGLWNLRTVLGMDIGDRPSTSTSLTMNIRGMSTRLKQSNNAVTFSSRERMHSGLGTIRAP